MTRAALITALAIRFVFGLLCAVDPQLDLDLAALGFDSARHLFAVNAQPWVQHTRTAARILIALLALPAFLAIVLKLIRPHRPIDVQQFGGEYRFEPWWNPHGDCPNNCSFVAGEPSGAFWTLAPAALTPPPLQAVAYGAALAFGVALGAFRMAAGAHFFSDVVFAGVLMFLVIWATHGLIYRWSAIRLDEKALEDWLGQKGEWLSALAGRLAGRWKKAS